MTETTRALHIVRTVAASPERVFEAWTDPEQVKLWTCPDPGAQVDVEIDLRVGGHYSIRMHVEGGPFTAYGTYREVDPPRRLAYTWGWKEEAHAMKAETVVTVEFVPVGGGTEIRLTHDGFPTPDDRKGHEEGWQICVGRIADLVDGR
ncbi:MAG: SRPBCC family protein [Gemmatimonadetes bacterium]|nr:SRPBCC family protein [Gemmatimonadota bacterium]MCY3610623.1 SRPBCC family protein [Gemmatimonadota bacterium]